MKKILILTLIFTLHFCDPSVSNSSDKSKSSLVPLALLGALTMSSAFDIPYATCEGAKEFTTESGTLQDETPGNTIKYFKFKSTKTEYRNFSANASSGNNSGSFCIFGFVQNQTVDNNSSVDTLETTSDYCISSFSLSTTAGSYRCIAVLALSAGGKFDLKTTEYTGYTPTNTTYSILRPDFNNPTVLTDGQTTNETFIESASYPGFKATSNTGGGKYFKFTVPANKTAVLTISSNLSNSSSIYGGFYSTSGEQLSGYVDLVGSGVVTRGNTLTAGAVSEDGIFYVGGGSKGATYTVNFIIQGKIETKNFISAGLTSPNGIAIDSFGNVYVADLDVSKITKYNSSGILQWSIGNGWGDAVGNNSVVKFKEPRSIAVDSVGNVYVSDFRTQKIKMIDPTGTTTSLIAGTGTEGNNGAANDVPGTNAMFYYPAGIAVDSNYIYVVDSYNYSIRRIKKSNNTVSLLAGSGTPVSGTSDGIGTEARFSSPRGLAISGGHLYITDTSVRKINLSTSEVTTVTAKSSRYSNGDTSTINISYQQAIAADSSGNVYVSASNAIFKLVPGGKTFNYAGANGDNSGDLVGFGVGSKFKFSGFAGLAFDSSGNLFVADTGNAKIKKIIYTP